MSMSDPISDMLTRIRNALAVDKKTVTLPSSKMKVAITKVLEEEGYIKSWEVKDIDGKPCLTIELKYYQGKPVIEMLKRVSKPSLRKYSSVSDLPSIWDGLGVAIVSTSKGVVTAKTAQKLGYGGEVICYVA